MKIEIDTELQVLTFDNVKISLELLRSLTHDNGQWFKITHSENDVLVVSSRLDA